jgi:hypothetical protein
MNVNVKTRIRYKGEEYASAEALPDDVRSAYEQAMSGAPSAAATTVVRKKIVLNGQTFSNETEMPADERKLYQDAMQLMRDHAAITPSPPASPGWLTKGQLLLFLFVLLALVAVLIAVKASH